MLRFSQQAVDWPFDLTDLDGAREFYGKQCAAASGAMLSMDVLSVEKLEVLRGLFKYRSPVAGSMGMVFVGILWIPFTNFNYQINIEAIEGETTGFREAMVMMIDASQYPNPDILKTVPWPKPNAEPIEVNSADELFEKMRAKPLVQLPSDDEQFDAMLPTHPLSLVRKRLAKVTETLKMDNMSWQSAKPFRIRH
jgi:hypothetical protein